MRAHFPQTIREFFRFLFACIVFAVLLFALGKATTRTKEAESVFYQHTDYQFCFIQPKYWKSTLYTEDGYRGRKELNVRLLPRGFSPNKSIDVYVYPRTDLEAAIDWHGHLPMVYKPPENLREQHFSKMSEGEYDTLRRSYSRSGETLLFYDVLFVSREFDILIVSLRNTESAQYETFDKFLLDFDPACESAEAPTARPRFSPGQRPGGSITNVDTALKGRHKEWRAFLELHGVVYDA